MPKNKGFKRLHIFTDGGSRGNPGPSAIGAVILDQDKNLVTTLSKDIGVSTNNVAEYLGVVYALQEAVFIGAENISLNVDSQLIARQLRGEYKVKDATLRKFHELSINLFRGFKSVDIHEIPREENKEADALVNKALDSVNLI